MLLGKPFLPLPRSEFCAFAPLCHCEAAKELALFGERGGQDGEDWRGPDCFVLQNVAHFKGLNNFVVDCSHGRYGLTRFLGILRCGWIALFQPSFFQTQSIVNVRRKWFVQPALTSEFVHYYHGKYNVNIFSHSLFIIKGASYRESKKMTEAQQGPTSWCPV